MEFYMFIPSWKKMYSEVFLILPPIHYQSRKGKSLQKFYIHHVSFGTQKKTWQQLSFILYGAIKFSKYFTLFPLLIIKGPEGSEGLHLLPEAYKKAKASFSVSI